MKNADVNINGDPVLSICAVYEPVLKGHWMVLHTGPNSPSWPKCWIGHAFPVDGQRPEVQE